MSLDHAAAVATRRGPGQQEGARSALDTARSLDHAESAASNTGVVSAATTLALGELEASGALWVHV